MKHDSKAKQNHLPRLDKAFYRGYAFVHWISTIEGRRTGWLRPVFYYKYREILTHTMFRYSLACPIFCLMPDHVHMVWVGLDLQSDQRNAMKFWRKHMSDVLKKIGFEFQHQPYDHVLNEDERQEQAFENLVEYIARNPERKGLVRTDLFASYQYASSLIPGYPELDFRQRDFWTRAWRAMSFLRKHGLFRRYEEELNSNSQD